MWTGAELLFSLYFRYYTQTFFVIRLIINKINKVQWVYFKLENVLVSLHSLKTMGIGTFGALYEQGQIRSLSGLQTSKLN
jgi:hypothetical protein